MGLIERYYDEIVMLNTGKDLSPKKFPNDEIQKRIQADSVNIQKICTKYRGSIKPWLPVKSQINVENFYLDRERKIGWCLNPKVSPKNNQPLDGPSVVLDNFYNYYDNNWMLL